MALIQATAVSPTTEKRLSIQKEPETKERLGTAVPWAQIEELAKKKDEPTEDVYTAKMPSPENAGPTATVIVLLRTFIYLSTLGEKHDSKDRYNDCKLF